MFFLKIFTFCCLSISVVSASSFFDNIEQPTVKAGESAVTQGVGLVTESDSESDLTEEPLLVLEKKDLDDRQLKILEIFQDLELPLAPTELLNNCEEAGDSWQTKMGLLVEKLATQGLLRPGFKTNFSVLSFLSREFPSGALAGRLLQFQNIDPSFSGFNEICHAPESRAATQGFPAHGLVQASGNIGQKFSRNVNVSGAKDTSFTDLSAEGMDESGIDSSSTVGDKGSHGHGRFYRPDILDAAKKSTQPLSPELSGSNSPQKNSEEVTKSKSGLGRQWEKITDFLEPANLKQEIKQKIAEMDIDFDIKMLDVETFAGVGLSSKYRYELKPSYEKDFYTRVDGWELKLKLKPGDWVPEYELPISLVMDNGVKINFVRQFDSQKEAAKAIPYTPKRLPFRAKAAIEHLEPGDFVSLPAHMNIIVSAGLSTTEGIFSAGVNTHYLMSGEFQVHVYRMKDNKVRLKLIAQRKRSKGVSATAGMDFKIFGIKLIDKQVKRFLDMNLSSMGISATEGNLFVLDYIFDLRNEDACQAYDDILASSLKFKNLEILNPFLSNKELSAQIIGDMTAAEAIFTVDREKKPEERRVDRIFKGLNDYSQKSTNFKVGMNLIRFQKERTFTSNYLSYYDAKDQKTEFFYPAYSVQKKRKFLFGVYEASELDSAFGLFECDEQRNIVRFSDYGFNYELKDNVSRSSEQSSLKKDIMRLISPDLYTKIQWGDWQKEERRSNARLSWQIVFRPNALDVFAALSEDDIYAKLALYIAALPELPDMSNNNDDSYPSGSKNCYVSRRWSEAKKAAARSACAKNYDGYWRSMTRMVEELHGSFTNTDVLKYEEKISDFMDLRKNWAFRKIGTGLMISLIPPEKREKAIQVNVRWTAKKTETLEFNYGDTSKSNFYNDLQYILSILNNRSIDMRLNERELEFRDSEIE